MVWGRDLSLCTSVHPTASALNPAQGGSREIKLLGNRISARRVIDVVMFYAAALNVFIP